jgi:DNA-binding response OmpR family regulator
MPDTDRRHALFTDVVELMNPSILIIDSNLGFAFWVAGLLERAGYQAFPARSVADATELLRHIGTNLQLLILSGTPADADTLVATLRTQQKQIRVLRLVDGSDSSGQLTSGVDLEVFKPEGKDENDQAELLQVIERMFPSKA